MAEREGDPSAWPLSKISPPQPPALISRRRLVEPLNTSTASGQITLVVAPGGSGKTSLLADWARQTPMPVAWYAIDPLDRDTRRFVSGLCAAIEHILPKTANTAVAALRAGAPEIAVLGLLLAALQDRPLALVLDDFQHLDDLPEAGALWNHLFRFRPPTLSLVILSRSVPLLGFAMLVAMNALLGLGRAELSFDADEAADLLAAHGLDASPAAHFAARSDGWATGVLLLARAAPGGIRLLHARTDALMEQLASEVLASLPEHLRTFLLESSALGRATVEETDSILGRHDSAVLYNDVAARGLFLVQEGTNFHYHDLFAEFFAALLKREQPARARAIRRAAATWWAARNDLPRALNLLTAGEDWQPLADLLEQERGALFNGLGGTVLAHFEHLPPSYRSARLYALCGHVRVQRGEYQAALDLADAGKEIAHEDSDWLSPALLAAVALLEARRYEECVRAVDAAIAVAIRADHAIALRRLRDLRGAALMRSGKLQEGRAELQTALAEHEAAHDEDGQARTLYNLASCLVDAGHTHEVDKYLARAGALWRHSPSMGLIHNTWAVLHSLTGTLEAGRLEALRAIESAHENGNPVLECAALCTLADLYAGSGDGAAAERQATTAADLAERLDAPELHNEAQRVLIAVALARRDRGGARRLLEQARTGVVTPLDTVLLDVLDGTLALRARAHARAADVLDRAAARLEALHRPHSAARALLLRAEALLAEGTVTKAEEALNRMAAISMLLECEGYLRPVARMTRQVFGERHLLRKLRRETRHVLDRLASAAPTLTLVAPLSSEADGGLVLRLSPFGEGRIHLDSREIDAAALAAKAREMLFYAARSANPVPRVDLLESLWDAEERGSQQLWDASRNIRRVLGQHSWILKAGAYALTMTVQDDSRQFADDVAIALGDRPLLERLTAAERALQLAGSTGGYLEWCESLWAVTQRAQIAHQLMAVSLALVAIYEELGRFDDAIAASRRASALDPLHEAPRLALIRLLAAQGQVGAALQEYRHYRQLLRRELSIEPSTELRQIAAGLLKRS